MQQGTIKFFNDTKGYGFIAVDGSDDLFYHQSAWRGEVLPREGMRVEFNIAPGRNGRPCAVEVTPI